MRPRPPRPPRGHAAGRSAGARTGSPAPAGALGRAARGRAGGRGGGRGALGAAPAAPSAAAPAGGSVGWPLASAVAQTMPSSIMPPTSTHSWRMSSISKSDSSPTMSKICWMIMFTTSSNELQRCSLPLMSATRAWVEVICSRASSVTICMKSPRSVACSLMVSMGGVSVDLSSSTPALS